MGKRKTFVVLGLPASGKGTQAEILAEKVGAEIIGVGNLVRVEIEQGNSQSRRFKKIKENYDKGIPQEDELTEELFDQAVAKSKGNLIFDNYPFSANQFLFFQELLKKYNFELPKIIYIKIDPESAISRIKTRLVCDRCKFVYLSGNVGDNCQKCSGKLIKRSDDMPKIMQERVNFAQPRIDLVIEKFKSIGQVFEIDGEKPIPDVSAQIDKVI
ncbi:MAG: adenylate kinase [Candidatus Berkelbacteria bacterium Athens1014_28]|uniref:Adenylate kinase n=1 Tax=Candidatus Berkelbacteria bacterium Athens1014_28 TaxID=2017145 RepID=A0A554LRQ9_9BACT|nr:MAG: adenylate kinase [Candidatus Berkelbacteria bacterium Athens1014_28]